MLVNEGKLTCISNMYFPPFEFMDEKTGEAKGFDIDLSRELAKHMGLEANWTKESNMGFDTLVPTISSVDYAGGKATGKADIAIAGITITDQRAQEIDFSEPYLDSNQSIVVRKDAAATTKEQLNASGMQIAVQSGTSGESWAKENLPSATIVPLADIIQALTGVQSNLYAAAVTDLPVSSYEIKVAYSDLTIPTGGEIPTGEQYGVVVSKSNPELTRAINKALADIKADGTMAELQRKWFGKEV